MKEFDIEGTKITYLQLLKLGAALKIGRNKKFVYISRNMNESFIQRKLSENEISIQPEYWIACFLDAYKKNQTLGDIRWLMVGKNC